MIALKDLHLEKVNEYHLNGKISDDILKSAYERLPILEKAIGEVEKAAGIGYPLIFVEPTLKIISYPAVDFANTVIYASTNIRQFGESYRLCVDISLPFLLYASEEIMRACVAHEFLHYIFITISIGNKHLMNLSSEDVDAPETHIIFDEAHTVKADEWLDNEELRGLIQKIFSPVIKEQNLENAIKEKWIKPRLPLIQISASENKVRIPLIELDKIPLDTKILQKT